MSYRPITDFWFLARCKYNGGIKRYGGYLGGFPERARVLIGCPMDEALLHVCGGLAKHYPYQRAFGAKDKTMDLDESVQPDILMDARESSWPQFSVEGNLWGGILIDPPYSPEDAEKYPAGAAKYPLPNQFHSTLLCHFRKLVFGPYI